MGKYALAVGECVVSKHLVDYPDSRSFPDSNALVHYGSGELSEGKYEPGRELSMLAAVGERICDGRMWEHEGKNKDERWAGL